MKPKRKRHSGYPWRVWIGRGSVRLRFGRDYSCANRVMAQQVRNAAVRHRVRVSIEPWLGGIVARFRSWEE